MLSRVAENIFWMSRYMERTNINMRSLKHQYISFQDGLSDVSWCDIAQQYGITVSDDQYIDQIIAQIVLDVSSDSSVINNVFRARENARSAQDNINRELWQCLNDMYHYIRDPRLKSQMFYDPISVMDELINRCMHYYGIINNSVSRSEGFYFLNMGKFVERGLHCISMLKYELSKVGDTQGENSRWRYFLMSLNGYELYLSKHFSKIDTFEVLEQMIHADNYPNSLRYCWQEMTYYATQLYGNSTNEAAINLNFVLGKSLSHLKYSSPGKSIPEQLQFLDEIEKNFHKLIIVLNKYCFGVNVYIN